MKKFISGLIMAVLLLAATAQESNAQFVIKVRPAAPRVVRVAAPAPNYIWVDEDWAWKNNNYVYTGGYWVAPPAGRAAWVPGHWKNTRRGWIWKPGHWR